MKKKLLFIILPLIIIVGGTAFFMGNKPKGPVVKTAKAVEKDLVTTVFTTGRVVPAEEEKLYAPTTAAVKQLMVEKGDRVKSGQLLAVLEHDELEQEVNIKRAQYQGAKAEYQIQVQELEDRKKEAETEFKEMELEFQRAKHDYETNRVLFEKGAVSEEVMESSKREFERAKLRMQEAKRELEKLNDDNYYQQNIQSKQAIMEQNLAELKYAEKLLEQCFIKSSINGVVLESKVEEESMVREGELVFVIGDTDNLEIEGEVNEFDVAQLKPGQPVRITGDGFVGKEYKGEVKKISPSAITRSMGRSSVTTVEIVVGVVKPDELIKPGFSANLEITTQKKKGAVAIPLESVITGENQKYVYVVNKEGIVDKAEIKTGISNELFVEVLEGVSAGDTVVVNPPRNLKPGQKVIANDNS